MHLLTGLLRTRRRRLAAVVVVVLGVTTGWFLGRSAADESTATTTTATVSSTTMQDTVSGSGTLAAQKSATLSFSSSGRVTSVDVEAGDRVAKGDELAAIDTTTLEASLASARAKLDAAQTTAADDGSSSSAQQAANTAAVASAEADVAAAEQALDDATLTAPFAGLVAEVGLESGDTVGGSGFGSGAAATSGGSSASSTESSGSITVITPQRFVVTADLTADDVEKVKKGMQAQVTPSSATEAVFGTVTAVGRVAEVGTDGTATFPVTVTLTGEQSGLYAGTSADVSIIVESREGVLSVPTAAVTTDGDTSYVMKVVDGKATRTTVTIGETFGPTTEVTKGLAEGDTVQYTTTARTPGGTRSGESGSNGGFPGGGQMPQGGFPGGGQMPQGGSGQ